ncbi:hypothetical protein, partial [Burkholderia sp. BCCCDS18]|uniref:hypothetical protein n=1 Tax=Burkholderia sp. BCCCDS18 TaxID=3390245 RepID=UPI003D2E9DAC
PRGRAFRPGGLQRTAAGRPIRAGSMPFGPPGDNGAILAIHPSREAFPTGLRFFSLQRRESG